MGLDTRLRRYSTSTGAPLRALDQQGAPLRVLDQQRSTPGPGAGGGRPSLLIE